jgi:hypothetical protein
LFDYDPDLDHSSWRSHLNLSLSSHVGVANSGPHPKESHCFLPDTIFPESQEDYSERSEKRSLEAVYLNFLSQRCCLQGNLSFPERSDEGFPELALLKNLKRFVLHQQLSMSNNFSCENHSDLLH